MSDFEADSWALVDSFADEAQTSAAVGASLRFVYAFAVGFFLAPMLETVVGDEHLSSGRADEHLGIVHALDDDKSFRHLYFDKFDRDNLIEHLIDAAGMFASHEVAAADSPADYSSC